MGKPRVIIYTDGSCLKNPGGAGGYAAILQCQGKEKVVTGGEPVSTNNRMEMMAAIEALKLLKFPCVVNLYTDSQYLMNGFDKGWVANWKKKNWVNSAGDPVKNRELWEELDNLSRVHKIEWFYVCGHSGHTENERCDILAKKAAKMLI